MGYTAVIRTKNSSRTIKECISSLLAQEIPPGEIIIVDSGSSDSTLEIVHEFDICKIIHYPSAEEFNYSKALNIGIRDASNELILSFSSHCILKYPNSTTMMIDFLNKNQMALSVSLGQSRKKEANDPRNTETMSYKLVNQSNFKGHAMNNPCALFRKKHWDLRPFNEDYDRVEDQEWAHYWIKKENVFTAIIEKPELFYDNQNFNRPKVAKDYLTLGHELRPYYRSNWFILRLFFTRTIFTPSHIYNLMLPFTMIYYKYLNKKRK